MFVRKSRERGHMDVRPPEPSGELEREVEGLRRDLEEAREQQGATSEVLSVLGRSKSDLKPLFETVVEHARRLCRADTGQIYIADGRVYRLAVASGGSSRYRELLARNPIPPGNDTLVGKVALEHVTIHIPDVVADPDYHWPESLQAGGQRTMLGVPMLSDGQVIGVISLIRTGRSVRQAADRAGEYVCDPGHDRDPTATCSSSWRPARSSWRTQWRSFRP